MNMANLALTLREKEELAEGIPAIAF